MSKNSALQWFQNTMNEGVPLELFNGSVVSGGDQGLGPHTAIAIGRLDEWQSNVGENERNKVPFDFIVKMIDEYPMAKGFIVITGDCAIPIISWLGGGGEKGMRHKMTSVFPRGDGKSLVLVSVRAWTTIYLSLTDVLPFFPKFYEQRRDEHIARNPGKNAHLYYVIETAFIRVKAHPSFMAPGLWERVWKWKNNSKLTPPSVLKLSRNDEKHENQENRERHENEDHDFVCACVNS